MKKVAKFEMRILPVPKSVPQSIAASIGRTLTRHSYLEFLQLRCLYILLEISIKQARLAVKVPRPHSYVALVESLFEFHRIQIDFPFSKLRGALDKADIARNILAHSVISKDGNKFRIQIVRGSWELPEEYESVNRVLLPETPILNRAFLSKQRNDVEDAIKFTLILVRNVHDAMSALHNKCRTEADWNRRHPPHNVTTP
jgi:hypothetical protein